MNDDFFYAILVGLIILFVFWIIVISFIYIRKPPKSKLTKKLTLISIFTFIILFMILLFFS